MLSIHAPRAVARLAPPPGAEVFLAVTLLTAITLFVFRDGIVSMIEHWERPEYSHGYLIPIIAVFLALRARDRINGESLRGRWLGPVIVALGLVSFSVGVLGTFATFIDYAFLVCLVGFVMAALGWSGTFALWTALAYLAFMVPLPGFLYLAASTQLQLISSQLGVDVIRLFAVPVFLEGNVIDLGVYKLQVAEACSGLRYLFPLMSFGFLAACLYKGPVWQRIVLFVSTVPITILMNSFRIGVIGVTVDMFGIEAAEGFLHFFEGWIIFVACLAVLLAEMAVLRWIGGTKGRLRDALSFDLPQLSLPRFRGELGVRRQLPLLTCLVLIALAVPGGELLANRPEVIPARTPLVLFPERIGDWRGQDVAVTPEIVKALDVDDYRNLDFQNARTGDWLNLWIAHYDSQRVHAAVHTPQGCIPGGGWEINSLRRIRIDGDGTPAGGIPANRLVITKGTSRALVYYWFQQRGRLETNEWSVKWYIMVDSVLRRRSDGALVRLVTDLRPGESEAAADARLATFAAAVYPSLADFIPQ